MRGLKQLRQGRADLLPARHSGFVAGNHLRPNLLSNIDWCIRAVLLFDKQRRGESFLISGQWAFERR